MWDGALFCDADADEFDAWGGEAFCGGEVGGALDHLAFGLFEGGADARGKCRVVDGVVEVVGGDGGGIDFEFGVDDEALEADTFIEAFANDAVDIEGIESEAHSGC